MVHIDGAGKVTKVEAVVQNYLKEWREKLSCVRKRNETGAGPKIGK